MKIIVCILITFSAITLQARPFNKQEIALILNSLNEGHQKTIKPLISDRRTKKIKGMVDINITKPIQLSVKKYKHFTEPYAIRLAKRFKRRWRTTLKIAQQRYGVDREVIVAILLVETSFGRFVGKYQPLSVFASIFVDSKKFMNSSAYQDMPDKMKERFQRKRDWALKEIHAISNITRKYPSFDQIRLRGSYAGAFGKCQFLPSSYLQFAVPFKKGQVPNLFMETDAIMSVANYLASNGYKDHMMTEGSYQSIYHYNNSDVYVQTVRSVARMLN